MAASWGHHCTAACPLPRLLGGAVPWMAPLKSSRNKSGKQSHCLCFLEGRELSVIHLGGCLL